MLIDKEILSKFEESEKSVRKISSTYKHYIQISTALSDDMKKYAIPAIDKIVVKLRIKLCDERRRFKKIIDKTFNKLVEEAKIKIGLIVIQSGIRFIDVQFPTIELANIVHSHDDPLETINSDHFLDVYIKGMFDLQPKREHLDVHEMPQIRAVYEENVVTQIMFIVRDFVEKLVMVSIITTKEKMLAFNELESYITELRKIGDITKTHHFPVKKSFNSFKDLVEYMKVEFGKLGAEYNKFIHPIWDKIENVCIITTRSLIMVFTLRKQHIFSSSVILFYK